MQNSPINLERERISHSQLSSIVMSWVCEHCSNIGKEIKSSIAKISGLGIQFHVKCVEYVLLRKLSWIINHYEEDVLIDLNNHLKKAYQELVLNEFFNAANTFQLFIYYHVQLVSSFLKNHLSSLLIDTQLESEICIVLYFTFLGIEINEKAYEAIQKKYLKIKFRKIKQSFHDKDFRCTKESFFEGVLKPSKKIDLNRSQKSQHLIRNSNQSISKEIKPLPSKEDQIKTALKEHLYVSPLPPLKPNKIRINEIQRLKTEPNIAQQIIDASPKRQSMHEPARKQRTMHVYSNQLSNSLKTFHPQQFYFQLASKKVKINRSFYQQKSLKNNPLQKMVIKQNRNHHASKKDNENERSEHKNSRQWIQIVGQLKKKVFKIRHNGQDNSKNSNSTSQQESVMDRTTKYEDHFTHHDRTDHQKQSPAKEIVSKQTIHKKDDTKISFIKQESTEISKRIKIQNYPQSNKEINRIFSKPNDALHKNYRAIRNSIRQQQNRFINSCQQRKKEMEQNNVYERWVEHSSKP